MQQERQREIFEAQQMNLSNRLEADRSRDTRYPYPYAQPAPQGYGYPQPPPQGYGYPQGYPQLPLQGQGYGYPQQPYSGRGQGQGFGNPQQPYSGRGQGWGGRNIEEIMREEWDLFHARNESRFQPQSKYDLFQEFQQDFNRKYYYN
eukprot:TRINITY_DN3651_c2_g1_i8.p2 TRINITY_DN3651_c2_g1~~TRINITY_DN3651_c2_g1_i8.p2  ORF type:complete len:147 (-),score=26.80 TRINITY_DN3651_c2_g1_i8:642-1082(-)